MKHLNSDFDLRKISLTGLMITLGLVYGSIGTSPLYAFKAVINNADTINELLVYGSLSAIFWTLTLQTTVKYILITLRANNRGEGGIFALFALIRRKTTWAAVLTMIGGAALLADGVITPAITVTSSIEGFRVFNPEINVVPIVIAIFGVIFFIQQFGINFSAWAIFGPVMVVWFTMLALLGGMQVLHHPEILKSLNPVYAFRFVTEYKGSFILLGAIFLAITGAESVYSDLGHCGRQNIRISWVFVKFALVLNYLGQGAWVLNNYVPGVRTAPFFSIMPEWFLVPGLFISAAAAIIATQSLIRGSSTLLTEAVSLNFWPKIKIVNPTLKRGQVYLPLVNWVLMILCSFVVILFKESGNMEVAYGLSISITMVMTTLLMMYYMYNRGLDYRLAITSLSLFLIIEIVFLASNLNKFTHGGWFTIFLASLYFMIMLSWYFGRKIKNRRISFSRLDQYIEAFQDLREDVTVPKFATNLVYIIKANNPDQVESKVIYSIFNKQPKRADHYWFLHVDMVDDPYRFEYKVRHIIPGILTRVDFHIGFKIDPKINLYFREVIEDLVRSGEINTESGYESLKKHGFSGDFKFVLLERIMLPDFKLTNMENFILSIRGLVRHMSIPDEKALQLDSSNTIVEKVPIIIFQPVEKRIKPIIKS